MCVLRIGADDAILIIKPAWLQLILDGRKTVEVRKVPCTSKVGQDIWLAPSGAATVVAKVTIVACDGPLSMEQWEERREEHRVPGERAYGAKTYAWTLANVRVVRPTAFARKRVGRSYSRLGPGERHGVRDVLSRRERRATVVGLTLAVCAAALVSCGLCCVLCVVGACVPEAEFSSEAWRTLHDTAKYAIAPRLLYCYMPTFLDRTSSPCYIHAVKIEHAATLALHPRRFR